METETVQAQADGVHITVDNKMSTTVTFEVEGGEDHDVAPGSASYVWPVAPGNIQVGCTYYDSEVSVTSDAMLTVLDPNKIWISTVLDCPGDGVSGGTNDYPPGAKGETGDLVDIARKYLTESLQPDDVVEQAGYPAAKEPMIRVVREGRVVIVVSLRSDGQGGWLPSAEQECSA